MLSAWSHWLNQSKTLVNLANIDDTEKSIKVFAKEIIRTKKWFFNPFHKNFVCLENCYFSGQIFRNKTKAHLKPCETSMIRHFVKNVNG